MNVPVAGPEIRSYRMLAWFVVVSEFVAKILFVCSLVMMLLGVVEPSVFVFGVAGFSIGITLYIQASLFRIGIDIQRNTQTTAYYSQLIYEAKE